jgi:signal transduction histidine kinase
VIAYADATAVSVEVDVPDSTARLLVADDAVGSAPTSENGAGRKGTSPLARRGAGSTGRRKPHGRLA